ncbi:hypothetical protein [Piscinibacter defluvii]|uniref:hypothetical protein n=1 Tax=Piscinibacter defluvii TaxID=1796922 RepID=UPI000FDCE309|nr:hypothetical protein [Piscinibacter defluvii]
MRSSAAKALSVGIVATLGAAGLAWHECVLLAAAAAAAHRLFLWRMDDGAPWDAWRAGVRCLFAGLFGLLAAVALFAIIAAGLAGYWQMGHHHARATLALVAAAAALVVLVQVDWQARWAETRFWAIVAGGIAVTFAALRPDQELLPCLVSAGIGTWLALASWRMVRTQARDLLRSDARM